MWNGLLLFSRVQYDSVMFSHIFQNAFKISFGCCLFHPEADLHPSNYFENAHVTWRVHSPYSRETGINDDHPIIRSLKQHSDTIEETCGHSLLKSVKANVFWVVLEDHLATFLPPCSFLQRQWTEQLWTQQQSSTVTLKQTKAISAPQNWCFNVK